MGERAMARHSGGPPFRGLGLGLMVMAAPRNGGPKSGESNNWSHSFTEMTYIVILTNMATAAELPLLSNRAFML